MTSRKIYPNYIADELTESEYLEYYYGNNIDRLINSKCKYDPCNVFTNKQGLPTDSWFVFFIHTYIHITIMINIHPYIVCVKTNKIVIIIIIMEHKRKKQKMQIILLW